MRSLTADQLVAADGNRVYPCWLARLDFASGVVRAWTGVGTLSWSDGDYIGVGELGGISVVEEGVDLSRRTVSLTLTGIPTDQADLATLAHAADYQGRDCRVYLGLCDSQYRLIGQPRTVHRGRMDVLSVTAGETAEVLLTSESRLSDWSRPRVRRYTHEDQQIAYPGDLGLEFVPQMVEHELRWGV